MIRIGTTLAALGLCVAVAACQSPQQKIAGKEDMMAGAGFKFVPANTPARQRRSSSCRRTNSRAQIRDGQVFYVYPDPTVCVCLYVGDQTAYANLPQERLPEEAADEQQMTANRNGDEWLGLGPWGGYPTAGTTRVGRRARPIKH